MYVQWMRKALSGEIIACSSFNNVQHVNPAVKAQAELVQIISGTNNVKNMN